MIFKKKKDMLDSYSRTGGCTSVIMTSPSDFDTCAYL